MTDAACPFCNPPPGRLFFDSELVLGVWDAFPVSDGHALLVTRRHVTTWFDATPEERQALTAAIEMARQTILARHASVDTSKPAINGQSKPAIN